MSDESSSSLVKPILIALGVFVLIVVAAVVFVCVTHPDALPFDYAGFDGKK